MNLFRSEEHVRRWCGYDPTSAEGILRFEDWAFVFGGEYYSKRLEPDFFLRGLELRQGLFKALRELGKIGPFWDIAPG